jgi:deoxyribodipyrimidine photo-lyase
MKKKIHNESLFIFTRDLRLIDNTTLLKALYESETVIPIFIFNPKQINDINKYKSDNCVQFMCECLDELNEDLNKINSRLYFFYDEPHIIIEKLLKKYNSIDCVYINMDYTPFAQKRSGTIENICIKYKKNFCTEEDYLLTGINQVINGSGNSYVKFTPFFNEAQKIKIREPSTKKFKNFINKKEKISGEFTKDYHKFYNYNKDISVVGGRNNALKILKHLKNFKKYNIERDYPHIQTTCLSAYLKFNVVSIREVYSSFNESLEKKNNLIKQLYWREFYMIVMFNNPHVIGGAMKENYNNIKWENNKSWFKKWCDGNTGFPIVDAGMRQMNITGFMHNRCRMIVSNFLIKLLHIDWRWGEKYFASKLVDYDPANNNGGWQWSSSSGADSQPYFRLFNPMLQIDRFDKECQYIKKWVPELKDVDPKIIRNWDTEQKNYKNINYPQVMIDYKKEKEKTIKYYKSIF